MKSAAGSLQKLTMSFMKSKKGAAVIIAIGILGILITAFSGKSGSKTGNKSLSSVNSFDTSVYISELESNIKSVVNGITGDQYCKISVTLESGPEYIYATRSKSSADESESSKGDSYQKNTTGKDENEYIIIKTDSGEEALEVTRLPPKVKGVAVVVKGGSDEGRASAVKSAVATLLDIPQKKISVCERIAG